MSVSVSLHNPTSVRAVELESKTVAITIKGANDFEEITFFLNNQNETDFFLNAIEVALRFKGETVKIYQAN